jgi:hypothetical protein
MMTASGADDLCLSLKEPTRGVILVGAKKALNSWPDRSARAPVRLATRPCSGQRQPNGFRNRLPWKGRGAITERCALSFRAMRTIVEDKISCRLCGESLPGVTELPC